MNKLWKLAAIVVILIGGQALGQGDIAFTVELGGDNHEDTGYNPPITFTPFTPGDDANDQSFSDVITWDVVAELSDSGDTIAVNGIANIVFDLEVREVATGNLVDVAFFSTVNDGSNSGLTGPRPLKNAAFCSVFNLAENGATGGRVFDGCPDGGPYMDRIEYPSSAVFPAGVVDVLPGELLGMGCGYSKYEPSGALYYYKAFGYSSYTGACGSSGGENTAGVGRVWEDPTWGGGDEPVYDYWPGLHSMSDKNGGGARMLLDPIAEGQIDMTGLPIGEYKIVLVAGNCNVLMNDFDPEVDIPGDFAVIADSVTEDEITFYWDPGEVIDWGDAPDPTYQTLLASNGPSHIILPENNPFLGPAGDNPDDEPDGQPNATATGDDADIDPANTTVPNYDDEDGVTIPTLLVGQPVNITFEVNGPGGWVDGWIDFNGNGTFGDVPNELVVSAAYAPGIQNVAVTAPANSDLASPTYARFRINSIGALPPFGPAVDGEVEDHHPVEIVLPPCDPPVLDKVESVCIHGVVGYGIEMVALPYPANPTPAIEMRATASGTQFGPQQIVATFDRDVQADDGTPDASEVVVNNGTVGTVTIVGPVLTATISGIPKDVCLAVTLHGIQAAADQGPDPCIPDASSVMADETRYIKLHLGDTYTQDAGNPNTKADGIVSIFDLGRVKSMLFKPVTAANFDCDVRVDNIISIFDLGLVKSNLFKPLPVCP